MYFMFKCTHTTTTTHRHTYIHTPTSAVLLFRVRSCFRLVFCRLFKMSFFSPFSDFKGAAMSSRCFLPNPPIVSDLVSWPWAEYHRDRPVYNCPSGGEKEGGEKRSVCVCACVRRARTQRKEAEIETEIGGVLWIAGLLTTRRRDGCV